MIAYVSGVVSVPCYPYHHSSYYTSVCRRMFECGGLVRQCDEDVVDGSAQRGAQSARSHVGWEHGAVRWGRHWLGENRKCVIVRRVGYADSVARVLSLHLHQ
jgi:hypothetical protein